MSESPSGIFSAKNLVKLSAKVFHYLRNSMIKF